MNRIWSGISQKEYVRLRYGNRASDRRFWRTKPEVKRQPEFAKVERRPSNEITLTEFIRLVYQAHQLPACFCWDQDPRMRMTPGTRQFSSLSSFLLASSSFSSSSSSLSSFSSSSSQSYDACARRWWARSFMRTEFTRLRHMVHGWLGFINPMFVGVVCRDSAAARRGEARPGEARQDEARRAPSASHVCGFINWVRRWGFFY